MTVAVSGKVVEGNIVKKSDPEKETKRRGCAAQVVRSCEITVGKKWDSGLNDPKALGTGSYAEVLGEARIAVSVQVPVEADQVFNVDSEDEFESELEKFRECVFKSLRLK